MISFGTNVREFAFSQGKQYLSTIIDMCTYDIVD